MQQLGYCPDPAPRLIGLARRADWSVMAEEGAVAEHHPWAPTALTAGVAASLTAALIWAAVTGAFHHHRPASSGCAPFGVYAQNRWNPYGARELDAPEPLARQIGGFSPNQIVTVDAWKHAGTPYPNNTPPFNGDIWFRTADHKGWVAFAAVRGLPTLPDPTNNDGGAPAAAPASCELS